MILLEMEYDDTYYLKNNSYLKFNNHVVEIHYDIIKFDGKVIDNTPIKNNNTRMISVINNKLYINGYEWKNNKWKVTIKSLFHYIFG